MQAVILAAGRGTRMKETIPKVLVTVENKPMLLRTYEALNSPLINEIIVVVGQNFSQVYRLLKDNVKYAYQMIPLGTMDALVKAMPQLIIGGQTLIVPSDIPYLSATIINEIIEYYYQDQNTPLVVGMRVRYPKGYGRIKASGDLVSQIIEEKDADEIQKQINIVNTAIYVIPNHLLFEHFHEVQQSFVTGEYYLTNFINILARQYQVRLFVYPECYNLKGANDISTLKAIIKQKNADQH